MPSHFSSHTKAPKKAALTTSQLKAKLLFSSALIAPKPAQYTLCGCKGTHFFPFPQVFYQLFFKSTPRPYQAYRSSTKRVPRVNDPSMLRSPFIF